MLKSDVVAFFGSQAATAKALGLSDVAICQWKEVVPVPRQGHVRLAMEAEQKRRDDLAKRKRAKLREKGQPDNDETQKRLQRDHFLRPSA